MYEDPKRIIARCLRHCVTELITTGVLTRSTTMICLRMSSMPGRLLANGSSEAAHSSTRLLHVPWARQLASTTAAHLRDHKVEVTCLLLHRLCCPPSFPLCCFGHRDQMFRYRRVCSESVTIKRQKITRHHRSGYLLLSQLFMSLSYGKYSHFQMCQHSMSTTPLL